jgi:hypothetical protein
MGSGASKLSPPTEIVLFSPADIPTANVERIKALEIKNRSLQHKIDESQFKQVCAESLVEQQRVDLEEKKSQIELLLKLLAVQNSSLVCVSFQAQQHGLLMGYSVDQCSSQTRSQLSANRTLTSSQNDFAKAFLFSNSADNKQLGSRK